MKCVRRIRRLEARINVAAISDPLREVRNQAFDRLDHSDRKVISHLARQYHSGERVEETSEMRQVLARWRDLTSLLASQPQKAQEWL